MEMDSRMMDLEARVARLEDALKTFMSSPQDDTIGSKQRAFKEQFLRGNGHVSKVTLGSDGASLVVEKVQ